MDFSFDSIKAGISDIKTGVTGFVDKLNVPNLLSPSSARLSIAGLLPGGSRRTASQPETRVGYMVEDPSTGNPVPIEDDWRVRVSVGTGSNILYDGNNPGIMAPLKSTQGVVFPYTPSVTVSHSSQYGSVVPTHSIYGSYFYESSQVQAIQLSGDFTVQSIKEGQYLLACIYFFRAAGKMFYGQGSHPGNPPPVLFLNGYGKHILPNVPCLLTSFQHVMGADVDYIEIPGIAGDNDQSGSRTNASKTTRVPTTSQIQIGLQPVYSRKSVGEFDLDKFAAGKLLDKGFL